MEKLATISHVELRAVTGGESKDYSFHFRSSKSNCFANTGRAIAHGFGFRGPMKANKNGMRPADHLILDGNNETGVATWSKGQCNVDVTSKP